MFADTPTYILLKLAVYILSRKSADLPSAYCTQPRSSGIQDGVQQPHTCWFKRKILENSQVCRFVVGLSREHLWHQDLAAPEARSPPNKRTRKHEHVIWRGVGQGDEE